ncbi:CcoQ/FixQ family Cbb3-type cytochrome c oxidase assembly chaperone [Teredinibacter purpureus]|jgi:Cbb3-type cytochrome oxidase component FixQ.|uniref:CcoQ/FixQ family Cbb3-type cytochrome c oxidase assembly chaperone n=1 Tax=Teredinibacter purpureus TaxID=2731756 RepID=UPI0005F81053|nr:CcoQ/FixQ family Cbb3-type cytochrome c oxidase assembly chaperone [Teredinibacter purpureus]
MDINDLRSLSVVLVTVAFAGICWWAFSPRRKQGFEDAANLPFADEEPKATEQQKTEDLNLQSADQK